MIIKKRLTLFILAVGISFALPYYFVSKTSKPLYTFSSYNSTSDEVMLSENTSKEMEEAKEEVVDGVIFWVNKLVFSFIYQTAED